MVISSIAHFAVFMLWQLKLQRLQFKVAKFVYDWYQIFSSI